MIAQGILLLFIILRLETSSGCLLEFKEETPVQLNCKPFDGSYRWRLQLACEVRIANNAPLQFEVRWFQKNRYNVTIDHGRQGIMKNSVAERVRFQGWLDNEFDETMTGDFWCQAILIGNTNIELPKSNILTIRNRNYYSNITSVCSGIQSANQESRCILYSQNTASIISSTSSAFLKMTTTSNRLPITQSTTGIMDTKVITTSSTGISSSNNFITPSLSTHKTSFLSGPTTKKMSTSASPSQLLLAGCTASNKASNCLNESTIQQDIGHLKDLLLVVIGTGCFITILLALIIIMILVIIINRRRCKNTDRANISSNVPMRSSTRKLISNQHNTTTNVDTSLHESLPIAHEAYWQPTKVSISGNHHYSTISDNFYTPTPYASTDIKPPSSPLAITANVHESNPNSDYNKLHRPKMTPPLSTEAYSKLNVVVKPDSSRSPKITSPLATEAYSKLNDLVKPDSSMPIMTSSLATDVAKPDSSTSPRMAPSLSTEAYSKLYGVDSSMSPTMTPCLSTEAYSKLNDVVKPESSMQRDIYSSLEESVFVESVAMPSETHYHHINCCRANGNDVAKRKPQAIPGYCTLGERSQNQ